MPSFLVKLVGRESLAKGTLAFHFERPEGFAFEAGQAIVVELLDAPAGEGQKRRSFSLVSAPYEATLTIATRMRDSAFKRALNALPEGATVKLLGPSGQFTLPKVVRPAALIAGGIGITPFISMLRQAAKEESPRSLVLIYSNRRPEDAAFLGELEELARRNGNFRFVATMTEMEKSTARWQGETGLVNAGLIHRSVKGLANPVYYVVGPPGMVAAMVDTLHSAGVPEERIVTEEFYGY
jgi:ferredoxin-NADP reductase